MNNFVAVSCVHCTLGGRCATNYNIYLSRHLCMLIFIRVTLPLNKNSHREYKMNINREMISLWEED